MSKKTRPTKKQFETLSYVKEFISEHGYSPSYREIMNGCNYTSVATVALHIKNLIARGHLQKRGASARSLEVVKGAVEADDGKPVEKLAKIDSSLTREIEKRLQELEAEFVQVIADETYVLLAALKLLSGSAAITDYASRLKQLMA